uniref:V-type proton ATPase subunit a n=1 Tax=Astyanax mexicanus TaxID=7994 RepID=A0A8B9RFV3_ASTMX
MGSMFRSEEVCLVQLFLQSGAAYNCVSELGELGIVEFRDLNPNVNAFQRKFVSEVRRCEELEKTFTFLQQEIVRSLSPTLSSPLQQPVPTPPAPQPRELLTIEEESERLARELKEVSVPVQRSANSNALSHCLTGQNYFYQPCYITFSFHTSFTCFFSFLSITSIFIRVFLLQAPPPSFDTGMMDNRQDVRLSFVAGVVHPWKVPAFERLLWRACRGYIIVDFREMEEKLEHPDNGEMVQWTVFLISYWGDQIGQKVKKICDCFHTQMFPYAESQAEREEILNGLKTRIEDIKSVMSETEQYLQQLLMRAVAVLPQWRVRVQKCKAVQMVLNLCSPSVTEKCLIAEAWCPVRQLPALQSALREGGVSINPGPKKKERFRGHSLFHTGSCRFGFFSPLIMNTFKNSILCLPPNFLSFKVYIYFLYQIWRMMFGGRYLILLMGLFSVYTGAIYNECFSRGLSIFPSSWHVRPNAMHYNWTEETFRVNPYLSLDPNVTGVFTGPYPFGIDPIWGLANNHLTFLNSYKMKMSVIIGVIHMTFGVSLSFFNYIHFREISSVFLVLIPELLFMLCLFGYLIFMVVFKWVVYGPMDSNTAPSILIHFIDMFLFAANKDNPDLYHGQMTVQIILVVVAVCSVPVLLLGKPIHEYLTHMRKRHQPTVRVCVQTPVCLFERVSLLKVCNSSLYVCFAELSEVLWVMVMHISFSQTSYVGSVIMAVIFAAFAVLTISILLVMEGLSAFLHALRLHWVEFQNKFYSGTGYKLNPFAFASIIRASSAN